MEEYGYFDWLCDKVQLHQTHPDHTLLLNALYKHIYSPHIEYDIRRIHKTLEFREYSDCAVDPNAPVSCLEVFVAIANDVENSVMRNSDYGDRTAVWFWKIIDNLGLSGYTDDRFNWYDVDDILKKFISRKYTKTGKGSIGYTHNLNSRKDFRKMDLWQQFNIYLTENYI